jgi:hypothetical protein
MGQLGEGLKHKFTISVHFFSIDQKIDEETVCHFYSEMRGKSRPSKTASFMLFLLDEVIL